MRFLGSVFGPTPRRNERGLKRDRNPGPWKIRAWRTRPGPNAEGWLGRDPGEGAPEPSSGTKSGVFQARFEPKIKSGPKFTKKW